MLTKGFIFVYMSDNINIPDWINSLDIADKPVSSLKEWLSPIQWVNYQWTAKRRKIGLNWVMQLMAAGRLDFQPIGLHRFIHINTEVKPSGKKHGGWQAKKDGSSKEQP